MSEEAKPDLLAQIASLETRVVDTIQRLCVLQHRVDKMVDGMVAAAGLARGISNACRQFSESIKVKD